MNDLEIIRSRLGWAARRRRWQRAWTGFWIGALTGSAIWLGVLGIYKLAPLPQRSLGIAAGLGLVLAAAGFVAGGWRRISELHTARWIDASHHLQERLSTALEVSRSSGADPWRDLVLADAAARASGFDPRRAFPFRLPVVARWTAVSLAVAAGLGFLPEYRSRAFVQKQKDAEIIRDTGRQLLELTRRRLETRPPAMERTQKALESVGDLGQQLAKVQLTRSQALRELASVTDRIKEQTRELAKDPALRRLNEGSRAANGSTASDMQNLQKQIDALQQQLGKQGASTDALEQLQRDLHKVQQAAAGLPEGNSASAQAARERLSQALSDLARKAGELGLDLPNLDEAIQALEAGQIDQLVKDLKFTELDLEKMAQLAKAMKDLELQLAELGKTLGEQLQKGQAPAAIATLNQMIQRLKTAELDAESLQRMRAEVSEAVQPGSQYGQVGEFLKQALDRMQAGSRTEAAGALAKAADELRRLMDQVGDCQGLMASLEALQKAQMCIGNGMLWGMTPGAQAGTRGGRFGRGVGTWGDDNLWMDPEDGGRWDNSGVQRPDTEARGHTDRGPGELSDALTPTKVRGQISPGGQMPSITLKGVSIKGQSKVEYAEKVAAAQSEAQSALSQDQVPRAYQGQVRDYFDDLKE